MTTKSSHDLKLERHPSPGTVKVKVKDQSQRSRLASTYKPNVKNDSQVNVRSKLEVTSKSMFAQARETPWSKSKSKSKQTSRVKPNGKA